MKLNKPFLKDSILIDGKPARPIDIELTNSCNLSCIFCPRDHTPPQGFMTFKTLEKIIARVKKSNDYCEIYFCGFGEPLLHPQIEDFVRYFSEQHISLCITTNGTLLTPELSEKLIDAGLKSINWSISGLAETYEAIHRTKFASTKKNILDFIKIAAGRCRMQINITVCDLNMEQQAQIVSAWQEAGIENFYFSDFNNRGGSVDRGYYFINNNRFYTEVQHIIQEHHLPSMCMIPFLGVCIGWNGNYYLCCADYEHKLPLGNVFANSIKEIDKIKKQLLAKNCAICQKCDLNTINIFRELLFKIERHEAEEADLLKMIEDRKNYL